MFLEGNTSILLVRTSIDDKCFVKVVTVQFTVFVGNHTKREIICFIVMQRCPICKPYPESFFSLYLSSQTDVAEICRSFVGNGRYIQEHARFIAY